MRRARSKPAVRLVAQARRHATVVLFWVLVVHVAAVATFTRGFLLTRPVLTDVGTEPALSGSPLFDRAVLLVVDALRHDFVAPAENPDKNHYLNQFYLPEGGSQALLKFMADPPTTTLQRLKGLTTGSLPTFIDAGSNFAGTRIDEDNWVSQAAAANRSIGFVGDDTWAALYSHLLTESHPFPSLNVRDLDTVDQGVQYWMPRLIANQSHDIIIGHMLGVDHAGHRFGPNHPAMAAKLRETASFVREVAASLPPRTILMVFGDHGMDSTGNHGGDSSDELEAALWLYTSEKGLFSSKSTASEVRQIDLVPTLAGLLGLPIPFNSLGFPIEAAFSSSSAYKAIGEATKRQISSYARMVGQPAPQSYQSPREYQQLILDQLSASWVQFDDTKITLGLAILAISIIWLGLLYAGITYSTLEGLCYWTSLGGFSGFFSGLAAFILLRVGPLVILVAMATGALAGGLPLAVAEAWRQRHTSQMGKPTWWTIAALTAIVLEIAAGFSNSYVIWESRVLHFILATLVAGSGLTSLRGRADRVVHYLAPRYSLWVLLVVRACAGWVVCREENGALCSTTFFEASTSLVPQWALFALSIATLIVPYFVRRFWQIGGNDTGPAALILNLTPLVLLLSVVYWAIDNAETRYDVHLPGLDVVKVVVARLALCSLPVGVWFWWRGDLCLTLVLDPETRQPRRLLGQANVYGSHALVVVIVVVWALGIVNKPPAGLALCCLLYTALAMLDLADLTEAKYTLAVPVVLDALGHAFFYWTGHQATIPSIQWDAAFIAAPTVQYPWSPLSVILNTVGPWIICTLVAVLGALWRRPPFTEQRQPLALVVRAASGMLAIAATRTGGSMVAASLLRRHLMTWKIFAPRFMLGGIVLIVADITAVAGILIANHTVAKVTSVFG